MWKVTVFLFEWFPKFIFKGQALEEVGTYSNKKNNVAFKKTSTADNNRLFCSIICYNWRRNMWFLCRCFGQKFIRVLTVKHFIMWLITGMLKCVMFTTLKKLQCKCDWCNTVTSFFVRLLCLVTSSVPSNRSSNNCTNISLIKIMRN